MRRRTSWVRSSLPHLGPISGILALLGLAYYLTASFSSYLVASVAMSSTLLVGFLVTLSVTYAVEVRASQIIMEYWHSPENPELRRQASEILGKLPSGEQFKVLGVVLPETDLAESDLRDLLREDRRDVHYRISFAMAELERHRRREGSAG